MKYLYTGWLPRFGTCEARRRALLSLGKEVISLSYSSFFRFGGAKLQSLQHMLGFGPSIWLYNRQLLNMARKHRCDIVWVDKGHLVAPETLLAIKRETGALLVCYNTDDIQHKTHGWRLHLHGLRYYDLYFTTNPFNVAELTALGAKNVIFTQIGFDSEIYWPRPLTSGELESLGATVGFIGHWEPATESFLGQVLDLGVPLRVRGYGWDRAYGQSALSRVTTTIFMEPAEYCKAMIATQVNLGINSRQNRNASSGRTFECPASGAFLLAARTAEHQSLYEEGVEAEFFDSAEELADKAQFYTSNEAARLAIAAAGYRRCLTSGYSWRDRMAVLAEVTERQVRA